MIATVRLGPEELAEILRDYCESRGYAYFQHGLTDEGLIELHIELPTTPLVVRGVPASPYHLVTVGDTGTGVTNTSTETFVTEPPTIVPAPQLALDLGTLLDPESTPDGTRTTKVGLPPAADNELADLFPGTGAVTAAWEKWRLTGKEGRE